MNTTRGGFLPSLPHLAFGFCHHFAPFPPPPACCFALFRLKLMSQGWGWRGWGKEGKALFLLLLLSLLSFQGASFSHLPHLLLFGCPGRADIWNGCGRWWAGGGDHPSSSYLSPISWPCVCVLSAYFGLSLFSLPLSHGRWGGAWAAAGGLGLT